MQLTITLIQIHSIPIYVIDKSNKLKLIVSFRNILSSNNLSAKKCLKIIRSNQLYDSLYWQLLKISITCYFNGHFFINKKISRNFCGRIQRQPKNLQNDKKAITWLLNNTVHITFKSMFLFFFMAEINKFSWSSADRHSNAKESNLGYQRSFVILYMYLLVLSKEL